MCSGYDVWMGNVRGNRYSQKHNKKSFNSNAFWDFTFDQHAEFDLPSMVDYVLDVTKQKSLYYIGHSMGKKNSQFYSIKTG